MINRKKGFTLAEVLITLGIIGVVAALTLPTLIKNYQKHVIETGLKQISSIVMNANNMAKAEYGDVPNFDMTMDWLNEYFFKYIKFSKSGRYSLRELGYKTPVTYKNGTATYLGLDAYSTKFVLDNGIVIVSVQPIAGYYVLIYFDTNGPKGPNFVGKDIFAFFLVPGKNAFHMGMLILDGKKTKEELKPMCADTSSSTRNPSAIAISCTRIMQLNNWKFKDDYPLKF